MSPAVALTLIAILTATGAVALSRCWRNLDGTTLRPAVLWSLAALGGLAVTEAAVVAGKGGDEAWASHLRYAAACLPFCPLMAALGAKRPQDKGWQFVVLTLWIVLVLPSGEAILDRPAVPLALHALRQWFLLLLIGLGLVNSLPTRFWPSSLLTAAGQTSLCLSQLPAWLSHWTGDLGLDATKSALAGFALLVVAAGLWSLGLPRSRATVAGANGENWDRVWRDFRDSFGTLWTLRVKERFNADAELCDWPARLDWLGLKFLVRGAQESIAQGESQTSQVAMEQNLRMLLRRFVSSEWIDERLRTKWATTASPTPQSPIAPVVR